MSMLRIARNLFWVLAGGVAYTYAGYPVLLGLLARRRPEVTAQVADDLPSVSVIIAAYNEADVIGAKLANTLDLDYPDGRLEIIVVADGSDDDTPARVRSFAADGVRLMHNPERRGKAAAISRAAAEARGDILVFSDANNSYQPDTLRALVQPFSDSTVGGVVGAKHVIRGDGGLGDSEGLYWRYESFIQRMETRLGSCTAAAGEILAVRRTAFEPLPEGIVCDDFYLVMRLLRRGFRVVYEPAARSIERVSASPADETKRRARIIAGRFQAMSMAGHILPLYSPRLLWQVLSHKFMRPLVPLAMIGMAVTNALLAATGSRRWIAMLVAQGAFYATATLGPRLGLRGIAGRVVQLSSFLLSSNVAALIGLRQFLVDRERMHLWQRVRRGDPADLDQRAAEADENNSTSRSPTTPKS